MAYYPKDRNPSGIIFHGNAGSDQVLESNPNFYYNSGTNTVYATTFDGVSTGLSSAVTVQVNGEMTGIANFQEAGDTANIGVTAQSTLISNRTAAASANADDLILLLSGTELRKITKGNFVSDLGGGTMSDFIFSGDGGPGQTIEQGNTLLIAGGVGLQTTASATDTVTVDITGVHGGLIINSTIVPSDKLSVDSFTLTADAGSNQDIALGNTMDIEGGVGIQTTVGATDKVTIDITGVHGGLLINGSVSNDKLQNNSVTINAGTGLSNGGTVALGSSITIDADAASTSQSGVVLLQDSITNGTVTTAVTPNAVYDLSGHLQAGINGKDNYQYWTITDGTNTENVATTDQIKFTGAGATTVGYNTSNNTVTITTAAGTTYTAGTGLTLDGSDVFHANVDPTVQAVASQPVSATASRTYAVQVDASDELVVNVPWVDTDTVASGPAQTIAFYSGDGSITGDASLTYNESATSIKLTTQGNTLTTGFYIANNQTQSGNMFQVDTYVEGISKVNINAEVTSDTSDGYTSTTIINAFDNSSTSLSFVYGTTAPDNSSGVLPFNIPNFDAELAADTVTGANVTLFNFSTTSNLISGVIALYTGSADPVAPANITTFRSQAALTGINVALDLLNHGGSTGNASVSDELYSALQQYWGLHPSNTGNLVFYWKATGPVTSLANNSQMSANFSDTGVHPRLSLNYTYYSGDGVFTEKTTYVVDHQGKVRLNLDDYQSVGNSVMIYASGQENLPCDVVLNSSNDRSKIAHKRNNQKLYSAGTNSDGTDWNVFDHVNGIKNIKLDNTLPKYRPESVIMKFQGGRVGIYDDSPDYDLDIHGDLGVRSGIFLYNGNSVGFDDTTHRIYRSGDILMWNGAPVTGAPGGSMTSWNLGVGDESTTAISDSETVTFTGLNQIITTRSTNQVSIDIDLSSYYTSSQVDTISGNLQSDINGKDNYQYWTLKGDAATTTNVDTTEQVEFNGAGGTTVTLGGSDNRVVTITSTDTTYTAGTGLTLNGTTFDANVNPTTQTESAQSVTSTTNKTYAIQVDASDYMVVNVPWTDNNTTYTAGSGMVLNGTTFDANVNATKQTITAEAVSSTSNRTYAIQVDNSTDDLVVNVPWTDNNTTYSAGSGLVLNGTTFDAQVDNSTIIISSDTFQVPDSGITEAKRQRTVDTTLVDTNTITKDVNLIDATAGNILVNLPSPPLSAGRILYAKKIDSSANTVTLDQNGSETVDDGTQYVLYNQYESVTLICDGTDWFVF